MTQNITSAEVTDMSLEHFPSQLVVLLYDQAIASLHEAIAAIDAGEIEARFRATEEVAEIIHLMHQSLDMENGGEVAGNLDQIYTLIITQLPVLNMRNDAGIANSLIGLLTPLRDSWAELDARIRHDVELAETTTSATVVPLHPAEEKARQVA